MIRKNPIELVDIGTRIERLRRATAEWGIHRERGARLCARGLEDLLKQYEFTTTWHFIGREGERLFRSLRGRPKTDKLSAAEAAELARIFTRAHGVLVSEARSKTIFLAEPTRMGTANLLDHPESLFAEGVFAKLPEIARSDFAEAGMCIVAGCFTAGACLLVRGAEAVLAKLYLHLVRKKPLPEKDRMWGRMLCQLRDRQRPPNRPRKRLPESLFHDLQFIKDEFRNPTQHPYRSYDSDKAQDLFQRCILLVGEMAEHFAS